MRVTITGYTIELTDGERTQAFTELLQLINLAYPNERFPAGVAAKTYPTLNSLLTMSGE
jgi:hypothetical protein